MSQFSGKMACKEHSHKRDGRWFVRLRSALGLGPDAPDESIREHLEQLGPARSMILNVLNFRHLHVGDVMIPRADIVALDECTCLGESLSLFEKAGHSRVPTYHETLDAPTGIIHIKDLMGYITREARSSKKSGNRSSLVNNSRSRSQLLPLDFSRVDMTRKLNSVNIVRPLLFVPPSMLAADLFVQMRASRIYLVLVVDEYGGTEGLLSIEDLVEEIVGDIEDEHDLASSPQIIVGDDGSYIADARALITDFHALIGEDLELSAVEEGVDTLGGLVFTLLGRVPVRGEVVIRSGGLEFEVLDADPRRVKKLRLRLNSSKSRIPDSSPPLSGSNEPPSMNC